MRILLTLLIGICLGLLLNQVGIIENKTAVAQAAMSASYDPTGEPVYWEQIIEKNADHYIYRSYVPGGWLVALTFGKSGSMLGSSGSLTFYPDPEHAWQPAVKEGAPWNK